MHVCVYKPFPTFSIASHHVCGLCHACWNVNYTEERKIKQTGINRIVIDIYNADGCVDRRRIYIYIDTHTHTLTLNL